MDWKHLLAYITGTVDQELLLRNAYLVTENRILRNRLQDRVRLSDGERQNLAEIGQRLGRQALEEIATIVKPDTILAWHRKLMAQKFDGSPQRNAPSRPPINADLEALVVRLAQENRSWGYDRLAGALQHLGYTISDQTVGNILKGMGFRQHRSVSTRRPGMHLSGHTWTCWWPRTFSPPRSGPGVNW
jgi:putative transposase